MVGQCPSEFYCSWSGSTQTTRLLLVISFSPEWMLLCVDANTSSMIVAEGLRPSNFSLFALVGQHPFKFYGYCSGLAPIQILYWLDAHPNSIPSVSGQPQCFSMVVMRKIGARIPSHSPFMRICYLDTYLYIYIHRCRYGMDICTFRSDVYIYVIIQPYIYICMCIYIYKYVSLSHVYKPAQKVMVPMIVVWLLHFNLRFSTMATISDIGSLGPDTYLAQATRITASRRALQPLNLSPPAPGSNAAKPEPPTTRAGGLGKAMQNPARQGNRPPAPLNFAAVSPQEAQPTEWPCDGLHL